MEASPQKLSAAVVVLLLVMAAGTGPPVEAGECLDSDSCNDKCLQESNAYSGGKCRGIHFTCWCITPCATTTLPPSEASPSPSDQTVWWP